MLTRRVEGAIQRLQRRLEDLADGHVELVGVNETCGLVRLKLVGGRLC